MECNICRGTKFLAYNNRPDAMCAECRSLERSRSLYHLLTEKRLIYPGAKVVHFAPELCLARKIKDVVGAENYKAYDLFPKIYPAEIGAEEFDLTKDVVHLPSKAHDLVLHAHVLEHLPCWLPFVLWHLQRTLTDNGTHLFCVPMVDGKSSEDFGDLSSEERIARFHQKDHVRNFGKLDVNMTLGTVFKLSPENSSLRINDEVASRHNLKVGEVYKTFFMLKRNDWALQ